MHLVLHKALRWSLVYMFVKECPSSNTCGRKGNGIEQELSCNASPKTASANLLGSCGAKVEALSVAHPLLGWSDRAFLPHQSLDVGPSRCGPEQCHLAGTVLLSWQLKAALSTGATHLMTILSLLNLDDTFLHPPQCIFFIMKVNFKKGKPYISWWKSLRISTY